MKKFVHSKNAPAAIGPYSQAVIVEKAGLVYTAGQIGLLPATGELITGGIQEQTRQALKNIGAILAGAGVGFADVVKTTVFLKDLNDFGAMNAAYAEFFPENPPARSTVQVARLPKDALVEIEAVAALGD
jgi:2-iminobutanoate/2-iminopropanoate deaminase